MIRSSIPAISWRRTPRSHRTVHVLRSFSRICGPNPSRSFIVSDAKVFESARAVQMKKPARKIVARREFLTHAAVELILTVDPENRFGLVFERGLSSWKRGKMSHSRRERQMFSWWKNSVRQNVLLRELTCSFGTNCSLFSSNIRIKPSRCLHNSAARLLSRCSTADACFVAIETILEGKPEKITHQLCPMDGKLLHCIPCAFHDFAFDVVG